MTRAACPQCQSADVMPSKPQGWLENTLVETLHVHRFRCRACRHRFSNRRTEHGYAPVFTNLKRWLGLSPKSK